ncbi:hypothetical protein RF11_02605 [Thelohanellus kitauei]|uniref:Methyltransferase type 12 domain-containing protein n=1 Tax=Thelohanellus kitauei TaxID=669202 RepID=A0A0C2J552_THEKT|nr:hypothetical protein RF11_02605 [Thelohanellus kitauei]
MDGFNEFKERKRALRIKEVLENSQKQWDVFYKRNKRNFYKDRHWIIKELTPYCHDLIEVGCGVGNSIIPILQERPDWTCYGCDFSIISINLLEDEIKKLSLRCFTFVCDISTQNICDHVNKNDFDLCLMIFVLSAIPESKFMDYASDDAAMNRFESDSKISENCFFRNDNTIAYYFDLGKRKK